MRRAIRVADITQDAVAAKVGISNTLLSRLLRGLGRPMTREDADRIRAAIVELGGEP